jgi:cytochrome c2
MEKFKLRFLFSLSMLFFFFTSHAQEADVAEMPEAEMETVALNEEALKMGKELFTRYCKSCHSVTTRLTGPALKGVEQRVDREWIYGFVRNSAEVISSGDAYAVAIFNEYNQVPMTAYPNLKNEEIDWILDYIQSEELAAAMAPKFNRPITVHKPYLPLGQGSHWQWLLIAVFTIITVAATYFVISNGIKINNS